MFSIDNETEDCIWYLLISDQGHNIPKIIVNDGSSDMPIVGIKSEASNSQARAAVPTPTIVMPRSSVQNGTSERNKTNLAKQVMSIVIFILNSLLCPSIISKNDF